MKLQDFPAQVIVVERESSPHTSHIETNSPVTTPTSVTSPSLSAGQSIFAAEREARGRGAHRVGFVQSKGRYSRGLWQSLLAVPAPASLLYTRNWS